MRCASQPSGRATEKPSGDLYVRKPAGGAVPEGVAVGVPDSVGCRVGEGLVVGAGEVSVGAPAEVEGAGVGAAAEESVSSGRWSVSIRTAAATVTTASAVPTTTARLLRRNPTADRPRTRGRGAACGDGPGSPSRTRTKASRTTGLPSRSLESLRSSPCTAWVSGPARTGARSGSRSTPFSVASGRSRSRYGGRPSTIV